MSARIEVHQEVFLKIRKRLNKINNMTYAFEESRFNTCLCFCVHCQFPLCSSSEFRDSLTGRIVVLWLRVCVWVSWLLMVWLSEHTRPLCWFFILYTSAVDFISLSCELCEILLKICRSILAQCQTTLPAAFVLLETNLCGRCVSEATLLYFFSVWVHYIWWFYKPFCDWYSS